MRSKDLIIESLRYVHEAKSVPLVPPNEDNSTPTGRKKGDTIKIVKSYYDKFPRGSIWRCIHIVGEPYPEDWDHVKGKAYDYFVFLRVNAVTGEITKSNVSKLNMSGYQTLNANEIDKLFNSGEVDVLRAGEPYTQGEVTSDDIRLLLSNLDADKISGLKMVDMVKKASTSSNTISIDFRGTKTDSSKMDKLSRQILTALDSRGLKYKLIDNWHTVDSVQAGGKGYTDFIEVLKRDGG